MPAKKMTNVQLELLKLFNFQISDEELLELKQLLSDFFAKKVSEDMDKFLEDNDLNGADIEQWLNEHNRIPYTKE